MLDRLLPGDELKFFSLDLADDARARVKVYTVHRSATRQAISRALSAAPSFSPTAFDAYWKTIARTNGPFSGWPISTYVSLVSGDDAPSSSTVHFPTRAYATSDRVVYERVCELLEGADQATYRRAIAAFAGRPLEAGTGMHAYVSLGQEHGRARVTVYLASEAYPPKADEVLPSIASSSCQR